jgi:thiol:disulfide interchange protein DsbC
MKKIIILSIILSLTLFAKDITLEQFNNLLSIKSKRINIKEFQDIGNLYILQGVAHTKKGFRPLIVTVSKDLKYTFFGKAFDNDTNEKLYIQKDMTIYTSKASFTYGTGKDEYYLFTDPQCPYCMKFEKRLLKANIQDKVKIHYFLHPLSFHKKAKPMSRYILSQKDNSLKLKALHNIIINGSQEYKLKEYTKKKIERLNDELQNIKDITLEVGIIGTPSLFTKDGKK